MAPLPSHLEHHSNTTQPPVLTRFSLEHDTQLEYGRGEFLQRSADKKTVWFYAWKKPQDFHDPHRRGPPEQLSLPRSQSALVPYIVKGEMGRLLLRLDKLLATEFANLADNRSTSGQNEPHVLIYARCCLDYACHFIQDPTANLFSRLNPPEAMLPTCLEKVLRNLKANITLGHLAPTNQPRQIPTFHHSPFQLLEADERRRLRRQIAPPATHPPSSSRPGLVRRRLPSPEDDRSADKAVFLRIKRARTSEEPPLGSAKRPIDVDGNPVQKHIFAEQHVGRNRVGSVSSS